MEHPDLDVFEVRIAEQLVESAADGCGKFLPCEGDERRALALTQVVAARFAGCGRIAEDAQDVVAQLKGHADGVAEGAECILLLRVRAADRRPDEERLLDGVARRLERRDMERPIELLIVRGGNSLRRDVEVLSDRHIPPHLRVSAAGRSRAVGGRIRYALLEQVVAPRDQKIAGEDRR